ncbi:uncharacterized protein DNG_04982 [Cephalotrichum gorgonifer]|uniref:Uncharacterized protein n=1 Tax=Cephalotrichum gorgonifer TaxID=2041049 RepID=A0AAE8SVD7_9PEZI|nr:uncharacterized protein DNG_04982 [Cephalotrichum gorgonifer]
MPTLTLSSGREVPAIAYGSVTPWMKGESEVGRKVADAVKTALSVG